MARHDPDSPSNRSSGGDHPAEGAFRHVPALPKRPVRNLDDLSDRDLFAVMHMAWRVATAHLFGSIRQSRKQNDGSRQAGCHFHVDVRVVPNAAAIARVRPTRAMRDAGAERLRAALPQR